MIWDVGVSTMGDLVVSHMDGAVLMDNKMENSIKLENVFLGGGICFLKDQRIVVICRCFDRINIYTPTGVHMSAFPAGASPGSVCATKNDHLVVTDIKKKCLSVYNIDGEVLRIIPTKGNGYVLDWPMYVATLQGGTNVIVSDSSRQKLFQFCADTGKFYGEFSAHTYQGDQVLRPHGLSVAPDGDIMIVDTAVDSVEVFHSQDRMFLQTLLQAEEVSTGMRLKAVSISSSGHMAIGCLSGLVRLYKTDMVQALPGNQDSLINTVPLKIKGQYTSGGARPLKRRCSNINNVQRQVKQECVKIVVTNPDPQLATVKTVVLPNQTAPQQVVVLHPTLTLPAIIKQVVNEQPDVSKSPAILKPSNIPTPSIIAAPPIKTAPPIIAAPPIKTAPPIITTPPIVTAPPIITAPSITPEVEQTSLVQHPTKPFTITTDEPCLIISDPTDSELLMTDEVNTEVIVLD